MIYKLTSIFTITGTLLLLGACDNASNDPDPENVFNIQVVDESFRIQINDAEVIRIADSLQANEISINLSAPIRPGDGGFNAPYSWHLDPDSVSFVDLTIEVCDGKPSFIEDDLDYWLNTLGTYCPWGIKIVK